jgi:hypothetical protein
MANLNICLLKLLFFNLWFWYSGIKCRWEIFLFEFELHIMWWSFDIIFSIWNKNNEL